MTPTTSTVTGSMIVGCGECWNCTSTSTSKENVFSYANRERFDIELKGYEFKVALVEVDDYISRLFLINGENIIDIPTNIELHIGEVQQKPYHNSFVITRIGVYKLYDRNTGKRLLIFNSETKNLYFNLT